MHSTHTPRHDTTPACDDTHFGRLSTHEKLLYSEKKLFCFSGYSHSAFAVGTERATQFDRQHRTPENHRAAPLYGQVRKSVVEGTRVSVRVDTVGRTTIKKHKQTNDINNTT